MRRTVAVLAGKATGRLSRLSRRGGGTTFPGDVARAIDPRVLRRLAADLTQGAVLITGTNGKTTTARLVASLLEGQPSRVVANRAGANLIFGATAAAVARAGLDGRLRADWGVFEIDEAALPLAVEEIRPRAVLVNNLFRDQLDRYGELELLARTIQRALEALPPGGRAVLNADDPRVGELGQALTSSTPLWYGIEDMRVSVDGLPHAADARTCPHCGESLSFSAVFVGHDGHYRCPRGDFGRPRPEVAGTDVRLDGLERIGLTAAGTRLEVPLGGLYNAYNLLGAFAVGRSLGLDPGYMARRLASAAPAFGRQERFERDGRRFTIMLAKNPTGFNQILVESERLAGAHHLLLGLNDRVADGRDVSWIWDVDFEVLAGKAQMVVPSGDRAYDMALRLKYAGVDAATPPQPNLGRALDQLIEALPPGGSGHLLCTYTAMLDLRALLVRRGWLRPYWAT
jgi:lipid II isoglutaminyl synthase (glutamine-hydrolysing)